MFHIVEQRWRLFLCSNWRQLPFCGTLCPHRRRRFCGLPYLPPEDSSNLPGDRRKTSLHAITDQIKCIRLAGDTLWDRVLVLQREDQLLLRDAIAVFVNICFCRIHSKSPVKKLSVTADGNQSGHAKHIFVIVLFQKEHCLLIGSF